MHASPRWLDSPDRSLITLVKISWLPISNMKLL